MNSSRVARIITAVLLAAFVDGAAHARVYKCTDASGRVTYSDIACAPAERPESRVHSATSAKPLGASKAAGQTHCQDASATDARADCRPPPVVSSPAK